MSIVDPSITPVTNNSAPSLADQLSNNKQAFTSGATTTTTTSANKTGTANTTNPKDWDLFHAGRLF